MAIRKVLFTSKSTAESNMGWPDWAVISIGESQDLGEAKIKHGWHSILRVYFHDVTTATVYEGDKRLMSNGQALKIVDFVKALPDEIEGILVHCQAGISRSAAVAKWICGEYGVPFNAKYEHYNKHVYGLLIETGKEGQHEQQDRTARNTLSGDPGVAEKGQGEGTSG